MWCFHHCGIPALVVVETLGHSQISPTMDTYAHDFSDVPCQVADAVDRLFGAVGAD